MGDSFEEVMRSFMHYRGIKRQLQEAYQDSSEELEAAKHRFFQLVGLEKKPETLLEKLENAFDEAEKMFHHQGG